MREAGILAPIADNGIHWDFWRLAGQYQGAGMATELTRLLQRWRQGNDSALNELMRELGR